MPRYLTVLFTLIPPDALVDPMQPNRAGSEGYSFAMRWIGEMVHLGHPSTMRTALEK
jgi:hypothetical protein